MTRFSRFYLALAACVLCNFACEGCDKKPTGDHGASSAGHATKTATRAIPEPVVTPFDQLAIDAKSRPSDTPRAEELDAALIREQVAYATPFRQVAAHAVNAAFCASAKTTSGVDLFLCEYKEAAGAEATAKMLLEKKFQLRGKREILVRRKSMLSVVAPPDSAEAARDAETAIRLFNAL